VDIAAALVRTAAARDFSVCVGHPMVQRFIVAEGPNGLEVPSTRPDR
jgi:hypothetical protein